jgi:glycosyltransferase involved in cell wall biosynthesis
LRIAFFGLADSFDPRHIGGTNSIVRRIAAALAAMGDEVDLVLYGCDHDATESIGERVEVLRFRVFDDALRALKGDYRHVITVYLKPHDRLIYAWFRKSHAGRIVFHHFYVDWRPSSLRRKVFFAEAQLVPFNGWLFCISPRIHRHVSRWDRRSVLLLPPVCEAFFCQPADKPDSGTLRITYAGRVDPLKGTHEAIDVMSRFCGRDDVQTCISGFAWSHKADTMALHEKLLAHPGIKYQPVDYHEWSPEVDGNLALLLRKTDIFLLPYRELSSTIDTPLLLLEAMAALCAVVTPPMGDLHEIYGDSEFNLSNSWNSDEATALIEKNRSRLCAERSRLVRRRSDLRFDTQSVTEKLRKCLIGCD